MLFHNPEMWLLKYQQTSDTYNKLFLNIRLCEKLLKSEKEHQDNAKMSQTKLIELRLR
jgi:hypothetical protein